MLKHVSLTEQRIHNFLQDSRRFYYAARAPLAATFTHDVEPIPFAELEAREWRPIEVGARWGGNWESAWFKFAGSVPEEWAGQEVWAVIDTGSEAGVFDKSGNPVCGLTSGDERSRKGLVAVAREAQGGEAVDLLVEAAANHLFGYTPDCFLKEADLVLFRRDRWDFLHDFYLLNGLQHALPEDHPRRARLRYALNEAINRYGQGTPEEVAAAREVLAEQLHRRANASAHQGSAIGHAHIDVAWLWPLRETVRKCARTFSSALCYMEEYPDYKFGASQAQLYAFTQQHYPALYERIKAAVQAGRWEVQGGMWVEADCNVPSGESLVRQLLHGKRFFLAEFGIEVDHLWLPDVFGYSAALPQILRKAGVRYFLTQKISWNQFNKFPHHTFRWEGIDGTCVFTHFPPSDTYNCDFEPGQLIYTSKNFAEKDRTDRWIYLFGFGDGGGGPSRHHLELAQRVKDCEELPRMTQEFARDFFPKAEGAITDLPHWRGELYLELHRGTLTSQARNKRFNRRSELRLREAEFLGSAFPAEYPRAEFDRAWKLVLLNQFHDIIPGSSITWVYRDSAKQYADVLDFAAQAVQTAGAQWAEQVDTRGAGQPVVVTNSLSWERTDVLALPLDEGETAVTVTDATGRALPTQVQDGQALVPVTVPALGHTVLFVAKAEAGLGVRRSLPPPGGAEAEASALQISAEAEASALQISVSERYLENEFLRVEFDSQGHLTRLFDKESQREALAPGERGNVLALYEDVPANWEAWDVDLYYEEKAPAETELVACRVGEAGPVRASMVHERRVGEKSRLTQEIRLAAGSRRLEFVTRVDWHEDRKMLRTSFPTTVRADQATFEIQYGHLQRPTHRNTSWDLARFEVVAHKWADLSDPSYGVALLNDCKYGHKVLHNVLDLNLLRSPKSPDPEADMGEQEFTYALFPHPGGFREGGVIQEGYALNVPLVAFPTTPHDGPLAPTASRFTVSAPNVIVEVVKLAEDDDALILRLYEAYGQPTRATLTLPPQSWGGLRGGREEELDGPVNPHGLLPQSWGGLRGGREEGSVRAYRTDLLERNEEELVVADGQLELHFGPFEIVTVRLPVQAGGSLPTPVIASEAKQSPAGEIASSLRSSQ